MAAYRRVDDLQSPEGWLPVVWDQLQAQRSVTSIGSLYLFAVTVMLLCFVTGRHSLWQLWVTLDTTCSLPPVIIHGCTMPSRSTTPGLCCSSSSISTTRPTLPQNAADHPRKWPTKKSHRQGSPPKRSLHTSTATLEMAIVDTRSALERMAALMGMLQWKILHCKPHQ